MRGVTVSAFFTAVGLVAAMPKASISKRSPTPELVDGKWLVDRQTQYAHHAEYTFEGTQLPAGLSKSNYPAGGRVFTPENVWMEEGYLQLYVPGGQTSKPYTGGEVVTDVQNILYASVRTTAIFSEPAGVCNGIFYYKSDSQETDIEWLSDANSQSNQGTRKLWLTNQDANGDGIKSYNAITPPSDPTRTEHEYRIDWSAGLTEWYVDGAKVWETRGDVPTSPGPWIWNNWADGDAGWSAGPPATGALFLIKKIDMYYNTA